MWLIVPLPGMVVTSQFCKCLVFPWPPCAGGQSAWSVHPNCGCGHGQRNDFLAFSTGNGKHAMILKGWWQEGVRLWSCSLHLTWKMSVCGCQSFVKEGEVGRRSFYSAVPGTGLPVLLIVTLIWRAMLLSGAVAAAWCGKGLLHFDRKKFSRKGRRKRGHLISSLHLQCKAERVLRDALRTEEKCSFIPLGGWCVSLLAISPSNAARRQFAHTAIFL